ncbi:uncharacterized protein LOC143191731 [Rhynchophorus ferrugineus]|uniref:Cuticle protein n=1 Tax=Rhynchophorus ferrugineus TaxID=354439 RepID=A0A834IQT5_RHYFE|nr:hypothetical protein GWI33_008642 [Rhynchophorus ferrugineus]
MKAVIAVLFAMAAVASAGNLLPQVYSYGLTSPLAYSAPVAPLAYSAYSAPFAYSAPLAYAAAPAVVAAPAIKSGYVAATPGAIHEAPLPEGPHAFSHHLNTAPAPGTL